MQFNTLTVTVVIIPNYHLTKSTKDNWLENRLDNQLDQSMVQSINIV